MLKVLSLNLNYYGTRHGPWSVRRELVAEAVKSAMPDIIALQAVRKDPLEDHRVDQATQLANLLPQYKYVHFEPASRTPDGGAEGSAILSRLAIAQIDRMPLTLIPDLEDTNYRVLLAATFELRFVRFHLFNAHFSWVAEQAKVNLKEAVPFLDPFKGPALLVGDLNQPPESPMLRRLSSEGWADIWALLCPGADGFTFEAGNLTKRIDYAWGNVELKPKIKDIQIVADGQRPSGANASDHLGLLTTLDLGI